MQKIVSLMCKMHFLAGTRVEGNSVGQKQIEVSRRRAKPLVVLTAARRKMEMEMLHESLAPASYIPRRHRENIPGDG